MPSLLATQARAVLVKHALIARRSWRSHAFEAVCPAASFALAISLAAAVSLTSLIVPAVADPPAQPVPSLEQAAEGYSREVWVAPCGIGEVAAPGIGAFAGAVANELAARHPSVPVRCRPCEVGCDDSVLQRYATAGTALLGAVVFDAALVVEGGAVASPARYRLRMDAAAFAPGASSANATPAFAPNGGAAPPSRAPVAYLDYVLPLQAAIDAAIAAVATRGVPPAAHGLTLPPLSSVGVKQFPSAAYRVDASWGGVSVGLKAVAVVYTVLAFVAQSCIGARGIAEEKSKRSSVALRVAGLPRWLDLCAWGLSCAARWTPVVTLASLAFAAVVAPRSSPVLLWILFTLLEANFIAYTLVVASFTAGAPTASGALINLLFVALLPLASATLTVPGISRAAVIAAAILSPCAFVTVLGAVLDAESAGRAGITWAGLADSSGTPCGVPLGALLLILAFDAVFFALFAAWVDAVTPNGFMTPTHPLFCCNCVWQRGTVGVVSARGVAAARSAGRSASVRFRHGGVYGILRWLREFLPLSPWRSGYAPVPTADALSPATQRARSSGGRGASDDGDVELAAPAVIDPRAGGGTGEGNAPRVVPLAAATGTAAPRPAQSLAAMSTSLDGDAVETPPLDADARAGIRVRGVSMIFPGLGGPRLALDDLSLDMYAGQCTAILGHNGAGKSTLQSILCGLHHPSAGNVDIFGSDLATHVDDLRADVGYCPQADDCLFPLLTVHEHLTLFGGVKGLHDDALAVNIDDLVRGLGLDEVRHTAAGSLSGGQMRTLSLAIAMVGNPRVLVLDEPTAGQDAAARRRTWAVLSAYKATAGRVIVLSTHHCDEAELLGDRIVVLVRGRLRVAGSPLYLRTHFGVGYQLALQVARAHNEGDVGADAACAGEWLSIVRALVPGAELRPNSHRPAPTVDVVDRSAVGNAGASEDAMVIAITLPLEATPLFPQLFAALESEQRGLRKDTASDRGGALGSCASRIDDADASRVHRVARGTPLTFSVTVTSLEEVFVHLMAIIEDEDAANRDAHVDDSTEARVPRDGSVAMTARSSAHGRPLPSTFWWLDARRRWTLPPSGTVDVAFASALANEVDGYATDLARLGVCLPPVKYSPPIRGSAASTRRQVRLLLGRHLLEARRAPYQSVCAVLAPLLSFVLVTRFEIGVTTPFRTEALGPPVHFSTHTFADALRNASVDAFWLPWAVVPPHAAPPPFDAAVAATAAALPLPPAAPFAPRPTAFRGVILPYSQQDASAAIAGLAWTAGALLISADRVPLVTVTSYSMIVMYNTTLPQVIPTLLSTWRSTALARTLNITVDGGKSPVLLDAAFHALPPAPNGSRDSLAQLHLDIIALFLTTALQKEAARGVTQIVRERITRAKHLQLISGVSLSAYWLARWTADVLAFLPLVLLAPGAMASSAASAMTETAHVTAVGLLLLTFGISAHLPAYAASFASVNPALAPATVGSLLTIPFGIAFITSIVLTTPAVEWLWAPRALDILDAFGSVMLPQFALARGLTSVLQHTCAPAIVVAGVACDLPSPLSWSATGRFVAFMLVGAPLWVVAIYVLDARSSRPQDEPAALPTEAAVASPPTAVAAMPGDAVDASFDELVGVPQPTATAYGDSIEDADVHAERVRVRAEATAPMRPAEHCLAPASILACGLRKVYEVAGRVRLPCPVVAVADLWLKVQEGEVFGLLGANGAGKSTALGMLVGELRPTAGAAVLCGTDPALAWHDALQLQGYCPQQHVAFCDLLTASEHLALYAALNGTPDEHVPALVAAALMSLDLADAGNTLVVHLSGGSKRRLSLVLAYIGAPRVVAIDEATTGVDPSARRRMFDVVRRAAPRRVTIATTHLIEEAATLCDRVGIMAGGRLACLGSPAHLLDAYGGGYCIVVQAGNTSGTGPGMDSDAHTPQAIAHLVADAAPGAVPVGTNGGIYRFEVLTLTLSRAFMVMEGGRASGTVRDYCVSASSLESVFVRLTRAAARSRTHTIELAR